ncbi:MAG: WbqC family protein [Cyclobacteriaceae bacterium]|nr:WbqC family protein [Cyclobacteriaceae bacterium]
MKLAIMQPYFFPYLGYFQLLHAVDEFIVYNNIEFTRRGWIHRNRILLNGKDSYISLPLKAASDYEHINNRTLAENWPLERKKLYNRIVEAYRKAPHFKDVMPLIENCLNYQEQNLFEFLLNSIRQVTNYLNIRTPIVISSEVNIDHQLQAQAKVVALCKARGASVYINPIGGTTLYDRTQFKKEGIELKFLKMDDISYTQFNNSFIPSLSVIDVMMFNSKDKISEYLNQYQLI